MHYNKRPIIQALGGNVFKLYGAFAFDDSPQGFNHWLDVANSRKKLSKRSRQYLNKLLNS